MLRSIRRYPPAGVYAHRPSSSLVYGGAALIAAGAVLKVLEIYYRNKGMLPTSSSADAGTAATTGTASWFTRNFYDGGFQDKMSRREAALILGVRESAAADRVKDAHRRVLIQNHPDRGGSPYLAAKINEAKEMLLKGK